MHDRAEAWALADRLLVLLDGRVAASGAPRDVLERPPDPDVAAFLGFTGAHRDEDGTLVRTRPGHVVLDPDGPLEGVVTVRVPEEDGMLCHVAVAGGELQVRTPYPGPADGEAVRLRVTGGVRFEGREARSSSSSR